ncbi:type II and III secretion system protein family protein [Altererythrobacter sp. FM1]|uniref:type II and III secretion system protein family protein n=1 Tax=Tsuneonella flava TaxID=2055955 RepID=UPI000C80C507|nr:type II and III secretion system protein family protein [Tsuneonella flava]ROT93900.1 type II and III secretion system protein family protein [Altererythrobacter sp. FM1]UBS32965.1 type II and III secretion system protein family protein [Altererythrobacter sp. N1]
MKRRLISSLLIAGAAALPLVGLPAAPAEAQSTVSPSRSINLSIGRGELINIPGTMSDVFVANDSIADVQIKSARQLYLFGKSGGVTTVYASNKAGDVIWSADIRVGSNIDSVDQMLALAMPEAKISVATMGTETFLLTGTVAAPEDAAEAERLVQAFVGDKANVISRLKTATPLQVNLQVKFAEVSRSLVRELGVNLKTIDSTDGFQFGIGRGREGFSPNQYAGPGQTLGMGQSVKITVPDPTDPTKMIQVDGSSIKPITGGSTLGAAGRLFGLDIIGALDLAERVGLVTTLSQPNLTALSGETADFLAGGEFPIPISQGLGSTSVEYRKYGVSLAYTPTVLANGRISLRVRPEVSELSSQGAVTLGGFQIPALTVRRAETTIELGSGQSFMIAGLMSTNAQNSLEKAPGLGDVPILGNLFRSTSFRNGETELVIIVTPYLVNPVNGNEIKLPTDGYQSANELQRYLGMQDNDGKSGAAGQRPGPTLGNGSGQTPDAEISQLEAMLPTLRAAEQAQTRGKQAKSDRKKSKRDKQRTANAGDVKPGFSF